MTLQEFLKLTAEVDDRDLRPALALALQLEVPRSRESYARFYRRVVDILIESDAGVSVLGHTTLTVRATRNESRTTLATAAGAPA